MATGHPGNETIDVRGAQQLIFGVGTDIVEVARMEKIFRRHGTRALEKFLAVAERADCQKNPDPARFLAKRFAAKEAFGKALGTGIRGHLTLPSISVRHDPLGKPYLQLSHVVQHQQIANCLSRVDSRVRILMPPPTKLAHCR